MGIVLDAYFHFAQAKDYYSGHILAMLDSLNSSFATLPPHWIVINPIENEYIREGMYLIHGNLCSAYRGKDNNPVALLLRYFACFTYNFDNM